MLLVPDYVAIPQPVYNDTGDEESNQGPGGSVSQDGLGYQVPGVVRCL